MFENLTSKLEGVFKKLRGYGKLNEQNIQGALKEVRMALLEADVNFRVVKEFTERVREKAMGQEVLRSITPAQQLIKIVHDELVELMGRVEHPLRIEHAVYCKLMLVGLQGSGKTTTVAKLARMLKADGKSILMVAADPYRPAAVDQLATLGEALEIDVYRPVCEEKPVETCQNACREASEKRYEVVIIDTAGRMHIDQPMMEELRLIRDSIRPEEILLVADAMTGQDAVNIAKSFNEQLGIDGVILTKMDGDARGGAALSIKAVTGKPIRYVGVGEKLDALELFYPDRMASRILGMGDVVSLVEKAQEALDQEEAQRLARKIRKESFSLEDFRDQLRNIRKMGPLEDILNMIPGMGKLKGVVNFQEGEKELRRVESIINSMTRQERLNPSIINGSRRKRIARGSGTSVQDVNRVLKNYLQMKKMMKRLNKPGKRALMKGMLPF